MLLEFGSSSKVTVFYEIQCLPKRNWGNQMRFKVFDSLLRDYNHSKFDQTIFDMIEELQKEVKTLQEQYSGALLDIKRLEEENVELTNELYRLENSLDARIDILAEHCRIVEDV